MKNLVKINICALIISLIINVASAQDKVNNEFIELNNGRQLSYKTFGNPTGTPIFYFHGFPGSSLDVEIFKGNEIAKNLNVRLIAVNRPGYGDSDYLENRTLLDWPKDIIELADSLSIDKFSVLAYSGGGPYALACAYTITERLDKVIIISGMTEFSAPSARKGTAMMIPKSPTFLKKIIIKGMKKMLIEDPEKFEKNFNKNLPEVDKAIMESEKVNQAFFNTLKYGLKANEEGAVHEATIYKNDWPFNPSAIKKTIYVFHGEQDQNVKIESVKYLVNELPNCKHVFYPDEGHVSLIYNHFETILRSINE